MRDLKSNATVTVRIQSRRMSSSTKSQKSARRTSFGSVDYRSTTLEPNHIIVEDQQMDDERWCRLAFALGMPSGDTRRPSPEASKFAQQVRSRRSISSKEMTDLLLPLLVSVAKKHKMMKCRTNTLFHRDGVPDDVPDFEIDDGWKMQLPTPKPTITLGYSSGTFNAHQLELQHGIISNNQNEPCDLHKLSQPVPDVYWPFFVVEIQDESMLAARNACAGSAATCNNALMVFAGAAQEPATAYHDTNFLWSLSKAAQSFSLAINGKTACLNTHNSEGCLPHAVAVIRTYRLDDVKDVESMAARIGSILVWAENCRLQSIGDLLNQFDKRVRLCTTTLARNGVSYDPTELANFNLVPRTRASIIKSVFVESLPRWARPF
ncbi:hypothetical protein H2200_012579 [Cladophialophora chaetospira]|uniref:DUF7924 domain-containing protein n=1 Tax=Cladophialophora chaetospira TaxID=386627 RepID=A0AA38WX78_9EURO|nr:hypothetical protein H2200_012579 [Cladophialophora chaetospira]